MYFDNSTTSRPSKKAISSMHPYWTDRWGVPSQPHQKGQQLFPSMERYYRSIYALLGASDEDGFVLTSSGPEGVNQVIQSAWFDIAIPTGKTHVITSQIDEAPALMAASRIEQLGGSVTLVKPTKEGFIDEKGIIEAITPRTALLSLSWANGLTGVVNQIHEIAPICHDRGIKLHLDASHVLGKLFIDLKEIKPDFITFNGDNLHAPIGTGGLWIRSGTDCSPLILGGLEQGGYRAGSVNMAALAALSTAASEALEAQDYLCTEIARLRNHFEEGISRIIPDAVICFQDQERVPNISAICFPGVVSEALLFALNRKDLFASIGGGCFQRLDLLLIASGVDEALAGSAVSFSLSRETTEEEVEKAIVTIGECVEQLRAISGSLGGH